MPSVPTFTLAATSDGAGIRVAITNPGTNPDHNDIYRNESGVPPERIATGVAADGTFDDYNIPSGITQFYSVRAVDSGGAFADSIIQSSSITLTNLWIHAIQKGAATNLFGTAYEIIGAVPQSRPSARALEALLSPSLSEPIIASGEVVNRQWATAAFSMNFSLAIARAFEDLQALKRTLCLRDPRGNILFGTLAPLSISYDITSVVSFTLIETDFVQAVA